MYKVNLTFQYIYYKLFARHRNGHAVHSPLVYDFIIHVLHNTDNSGSFASVESYRNECLNRKEIIELTDLGSGHGNAIRKRRKVCEIARTSPVNPKFGRMLYALSRHYRPGTIIELGTSLGISTMYLAAGNPSARIVTVEADKNLAAIAAREFAKRNLNNIELIASAFDTVLPSLANELTGESLVFIDGNHRKKAVISYCELLMRSKCNMLIIVLDDIRWSGEMTEAWNELKSHNKARITIDLFFMGLIVVRENISKQNFIIKY